MNRIIGCGNPDRGDDAAGLLVARRLRGLGINAREHSGDGLSLLEAWRGCESVVLIDSVVTGRPPGEISVWDAHDAPVTGDIRRATSHFFGVAEAIQLGRILDRLPPRVTIYGIEADRFDFGSAPSPAVEEAVERLVLQLAAEGMIAAPNASAPPQNSSASSPGRRSPTAV